MLSVTSLRRLCTGAALAAAAVAQAFGLTSPKEHFGFAIGDDYQLTTFTQTEAYFKKLAAESDRVQFVDIGPTEEGRRQPMLIVSSPQNLQMLDRYREISGKLARAEGLDDAQARALAAEGKAVVWIDGALHSTEVVGTHQLIETAWQLASRTDPETLRILDRVVVLLVHANPDGHELVSDWYMRRADPKTRVQDSIPRLYQKYIGHDNNRDFMMMHMKETTNLTRLFYLEWFPQIVYNHHQTAPPGTVVAAPPYRDPFNYVFDPLLMSGIDSIGAAMHSRWIAEDMPGSTQKRGSVFSTWYNGGLRTTGYFHNQLGLLTEIIGSPTPMQVVLVPDRQVPSGDNLYPVPPQTWHFRRSIDYSVTANYAVLDYAARNADTLLFNVYKMGRNSIERGSKDSWTLLPSRVAALKAADAKEKAAAKEKSAAAGPATSMESYRTAGANPKLYDEHLRAPALRDPRGYIIPATQADLPTAVKFVNVLLKSGILVQKATAPFTVAGKDYPAGSYIVKTDQAFRPYVLDMFEPQDHPNDFLYEGGPPIPPYDSAGWTIAYLMGLKFDRLQDGFDGPFERIAYGQLESVPAGKIAGTGTAGWVTSHAVNHSFILANRLLKAGLEAHWLKTGVAGEPALGPGALFIPASPAAQAVVEKAAVELGLDFTAVAAKPAGGSLKLAPFRIGLWDNYGGSMPSGWIRWLFEQFEFPFEVVYPQQIDAGNLRARYDALVFVGGAIPALRADGEDDPYAAFRPRTPKPEDMPAEFRGRLGRLTAEKSIPALKKFLEDGGSVVAIGSSTSLAYHLGLPVRSALTERDRDGKEKPLGRDKYYVPGSVLRVSVDPSLPLAWGMESTADVYFSNSPVFDLTPEAVAKGLKPAAWFASDKPLRSGWAWGQQYLADGIQALEAPYGTGKVFLLAPEVTFRAQPYGTFKLFFNPLFLSTAEAAE